MYTTANTAYSQLYELTRGLVRDGKQSRDPQSHASGNRIYIHPEWDPRNDYHENGGQVTLHQVKSQWSGEVESG